MFRTILKQTNIYIYKHIYIYICLTRRLRRIDAAAPRDLVAETTILTYAHDALSRIELAVHTRSPALQKHLSQNSYGDIVIRYCIVYH